MLLLYVTVFQKKELQEATNIVRDLYKRSGATNNQITYLKNKWANAYEKEDKKLRGLS